MCIPVTVNAELIEVPKPTRPGRITVPETIPITSTLQDIDDEIARVATISNATQLTVQNQSVSSNFANSYNTSLQNFPTFPVALGPTFKEALLYQNIPSLTSMINPPQFLMASSPAITSVAASDEIVRLAHSGGGQIAAGGSFFGPNLLPPLGLSFGQGPVAAPFLGPSFPQPVGAPLPGAVGYQSGPILRFPGIANGQFGIIDPFYPFAPTSLPGFRGPAWYPPEIGIGYPLPLPLMSIPFPVGLPPYQNNPFLFGDLPLLPPQPNLLPVFLPRLFW